MIDYRKTLTDLHKEFPEFDLDTLFKIIDLISEEKTLYNPSYPISVPRTPADNPWYTNLTCDKKQANLA